ncbi:MAG: alcohol dehydrogenase catalytic domain-containing protein [Rhodospirillales bacterium]|nr:alcohol dehydrogenase catalytic domain-containing protein [Rhodospirillales bacterium]MDH3792153.1 alcohol dehydrogenase catalytic domain-containing protein [Rhodospirillales bacterium]MDH3911238.1 alcohol dehydrogenase catalytic domain-containing protein [Rhodospirillales bacterium]MDH3917439.1 alcohol dehydrogenase catalytic domain-containing protein [Rhodospirillales bacterium]MDH3966180.1 alcohol dehydrogenase catalytic domain-containing protein [Rhodospirillales bacterium]
MKALIYTATEATEYRDAPAPTQGAGDALVKVEAVGICGSDMHAWHGHDPRRVPPLILGHEACGTVLDGPDPGARVVFNPLITCGACEFCQTGRSNLCAGRELIGMRRPGAFAERVALPARNLIPVPAGMDPAKAALTEPCATAWHGLALAARASWRPIPECRTLVIGGGSVGLLGGLILKSWGARGVRLAETNRLRRETAAAAGLEVFDPLAVPAESAEYDLVLDAVGAAATRAAAIAAVRPGGVISHVGLQDWAGAFDARTLTLSEVTLIGVYTYTDADLRASLAALHDGRLGKLDWIEERPLAEGGQAFHDLHAGRTPAAKIILRP